MKMKAGCSKSEKPYATTAVLPEPARCEAGVGNWIKTHDQKADTRMRVFANPVSLLDSQLAVLRGFLADDQMFGVEEVAAEQECDVALLLSLEPRPLPGKLAEAGFFDERHRITISSERIRVEAASLQGVARGIQSLRQLLSGQRARLTLPCQVIEDEPAMIWRGMHLDASRHFWDVPTLKRHIDLMALHKFNVFHWHLTDDQGWRLPVEGYPRLTEIAAWRSGTMVGHDRNCATNPSDDTRHGGFYTHEEIRDVVVYAAARGMHVLPEVDLPGHVQALVAAYPEFGTAPAHGVRQNWGISPYALNLEPETFRFLEELLDTLAELFPFHYVHLGGDEVMTGQWEASPRIQKQRRALGIESDRGVQHHFTVRLQEMLRARGRRFIGWDEVVSSGALEPESAVMFWRDWPAGSDGHSASFDPVIKALETGNGLVLANLAKAYFDFYQVAEPEQAHEPLAIGNCLTLETVYGWNPLQEIPAALRGGVLGAQGQLWTEYIPTRNHLDYMAFPRACALAQVLWTGENREPFAQFLDRLKIHLMRLDRLGVTYRAPELI